ncbi:MAG TPA: phosphate signaling complex protein PhoU [Syntrophomonadaceae bacterium]|nr:phosphate signaling complex protein PhoU [Syntrophomonadaceae bacterium]HPR94107.1 phosphate signaling complex protein PhoU [Syntrophomonadaceae bacterium]
MTNEPLAKELVKLKEEVTIMGRLLADQVLKSVKALVDKDSQLAKEVVEKDDMVDKMETDLERKALGLIALKQPMAGDLRLIGTVLRMIVDIERMADHAEDIARIAIELHDEKYIKPLIDIPRMSNVAQEMIETALVAFIEEDVDKVNDLIPMEIEMDNLYDQTFRELLSYMLQDQKNIPQATQLLLVAGHLERLGDHATNLGECVIYTVKGEKIDLNQIARQQKNN